jgi:UDP-N-acetylmuramate dehydrogenase
LLDRDIELSNYCFYKTGGLAKFFARPQILEDLQEILSYARQNNLKYYVFGVGSNILFSDESFEGIVITLKNLNKWIYFDDEYFYAGAGVLLDDFIKFTMNFGFSKIVYLSGIPGTIGGALYMNAGAFGVEIKDFVVEAQVLKENLDIQNLKNSEIGFSYRQALQLVNNIVLSAKFKLAFSANKLKSSKVRNTVLYKRKVKQPLEYPSCGSVFKRGPSYYAGALIEKCGLKGYSIGNCEVSTKHANFIINKGNAKSLDIYKLILYVKEEVYKKYGITLEEEVKLIGFI